MLDFRQTIRIAKDGELTVLERIEVLAEGRDIRRGIFRDFPTTYRDSRGVAKRVPFDVFMVTRDGADERYVLEDLSNGKRVRIGNAAVMLPRGVHVYEIGYRTSRQLGFFPTHDELYWNVNGNGWVFGFDAISAEVQLPAAVPASEIQVEAYTGSQGARGGDYESEVREGGAQFRTTRALGPHQGLTIVVGFPKGVVAPPGAASRFSGWMRDNLGIVLGAGGLALLFAFLYWRWWLVGRDPRAGVKYPRYAAPKGLGPAGVRYVDRMGYDDRCFAAALLGLGSRGFLRIREKGGTFAVERVAEQADWYPGEQSLARWLLPAKGAIQTLSKTYDPSVAIARESFSSGLQAHFGERLFSRNHGSFGAGVLLAAAFWGAMIWMDAPQAALFGFGAGMALMLIAFKALLPAYSVQGRRLQDEIEGLRQYLSVAEADDLRRMKAPPQTAEEFAKFLPYAVALDVEKTWADRFAATLGAAAVSAAVADYYLSDTPGYGSHFGSSFGSSVSGLAGTVASASTAPGSSSGFSSGGGGGGGSSGGGGGGGGGGGW